MNPIATISTAIILTASTVTFDPVQGFDDFFLKNYSQHHKQINYLWRGELNPDERNERIHDAYISCKQAISNKGFNHNHNYAGYFYRVLRNMMISEKKELKNKKVILEDLTDINVQKEMEDKINQWITDDMNLQEYYSDIEYLSVKIFEFVKKTFSEKQFFIFKNYYLMGYNSYPKTAEVSGLHYKTIKKNISNMKSKIRTDFPLWLQKNKD